MKNVTITVDDAALEWVRVKAARQGTSVSRLVGEMLVEKMRHEDAYARAMQDALKFESWGCSEGRYPTRDEIYAERLDRFR